MRNNSLLKKGLLAVSTAAFAAVLGFGFKVDAASLDTSKIEVNASYKFMSLSDVTDSEVLVGYGKADKKSVVSIADTDYDVYNKNSEGRIIVDLTHLNPKNDNYIVLKGNVNQDPVVIKVGKNADKLKVKAVKYDKVTSEPSFEFAKGSETFVATGGSIQARTENAAEWYDYEEGDSEIASLVNRGGTVYFRLPGSEGGTIEKKAKDIEKVYLSKDDEKAKKNEVEVFENVGASAIQFPGAEIKAKISARAKGPAIAVDYVKDTYTIKAKSAYKTYTDASSAGTTTTGFTTTDTKKQVSVSGASATIVESKVAVPENQKKPSSRISTVILPGVEDITSTITNGGATANVTGASIVVSGGSAKVEFDATQSNKDNFAFKNGTEYTYEFFVGDKPSGDFGAKASGSKSVKPGKTVKIKIKDMSGKTVWVRKAGDKKAKYFTTDWVAFGKVGGESTGGTSTGSSKADVTLALARKTGSGTGINASVQLELTGVPSGTASDKVVWSVSGEGAELASLTEKSISGVTVSNSNTTGSAKNIKITASYAGDDTHNAKEVSIDLSLNDQS
jgi:hypothetical protein